MDGIADIAEIAERLSYDPATGLFHWSSSSRPGWTGKQAGCFDAITGYIRIGVAGKVRYAHRIAWAMTHGEWPSQLDHINCDRTDNRIANLRIATCAENSRNRVTSGRNKSGLKGASFDQKKGVWLSTIGADRKTHYLGRFETKKEAHDAYVAAANRLHGEFARAV